jgi:hypothetical protein
MAEFVRRSSAEQSSGLNAPLCRPGRLCVRFDLEPSIQYRPRVTRESQHDLHYDLHSPLRQSYHGDCRQCLHPQHREDGLLDRSSNSKYNVAHAGGDNLNSVENHDMNRTAIISTGQKTQTLEYPLQATNCSSHLMHSP